MVNARCPELSVRCGSQSGVCIWRRCYLHRLIDDSMCMMRRLIEGFVPIVSKCSLRSHIRRPALVDATIIVYHKVTGRFTYSPNETAESSSYLGLFETD